MAIYAQHGYGKTNKIDQGLQSGLLEGVILSPQYEKPDKLRKYVVDLNSRFSQKHILIDPQFYVSALSGTKKEGRLPEYPYYHTELTRRNLRSPKNITKYVKDTIKFQNKLPVTEFISPTILFRQTDEAYFDFSLQFAEESIEYCNSFRNSKPLFLSLVFSEDILKNRNMTDNLLDEISLYDADGFYIVIEHTESSYSLNFNIDILANLLYLTYSLTEINEFSVIFGYSSFVGLLLHMAGASATACGWFGTSKQFSLSRFRPSKGGRLPRPRYSSISLLDSVLVNPVLSSCAEIDLLEHVLSGTSFDDKLTPSPDPAKWPRETSTLHHWETLTNSVNNLLAQGDIDSRIVYMLDAIETSKKLYKQLMKKGIQFGAKRAHLRNWKKAIEKFKLLL